MKTGCLWNGGNGPKSLGTLLRQDDLVKQWKMQMSWSGIKFYQWYTISCLLKFLRMSVQKNMKPVKNGLCKYIFQIQKQKGFFVSVYIRREWNIIITVDYSRSVISVNNCVDRSPLYKKVEGWLCKKNAKGYAMKFKIIPVWFNLTLYSSPIFSTKLL